MCSCLYYKAHGAFFPLDPLVLCRKSQKSDSCSPKIKTADCKEFVTVGNKNISIVKKLISNIQSFNNETLFPILTLLFMCRLINIEEINNERIRQTSNGLPQRTIDQWLVLQSDSCNCECVHSLYSVHRQICLIISNGFSASTRYHCCLIQILCVLHTLLYYMQIPANDASLYR